MGNYAKLYSFQDSSIMELDVVIRFIFLFMLGEADFNGFFDGSPRSLARRANVPLKDMRRALDIFQSPDPSSKSKLEEGKRLIYQGANRWWLVNYVEYRTKDGDGKDYQQMQWRKRAAKKLALDKGEKWDESEWYRQDALRQGTSRELTGTHDYKDKDKDKIVPTVHVGIVEEGKTVNTVEGTSVVPGKRKPVSENPPTPEDIYEYFLEKGYSKKSSAVLDLAKEIVEHHENGGNWRQGNGKPIYVWKSHALQWARNRNLPEDLMAKSRKTDEVRRANAKM